MFIQPAKIITRKLYVLFLEASLIRKAIPQELGLLEGQLHSVNRFCRKCPTYGPEQQRPVMRTSRPNREGNSKKKEKKMMSVSSSCLAKLMMACAGRLPTSDVTLRRSSAAPAEALRMTPAAYVIKSGPDVSACEAAQGCLQRIGVLFFCVV